MNDLFIILFFIFVFACIILPTFILILYNYIKYFYNEYHNIKNKGLKTTDFLDRPIELRDFNKNPITIGEVHKAVINSIDWKYDFKCNISYIPGFSHIWLIVKTIYLIIKGIKYVLNYIICKKLKLDYISKLLCKSIYKYVLKYIYDVILYLFRLIYKVYDIIRKKIWEIKI